jgi:hypothetical protein
MEARFVTLRFANDRFVRANEETFRVLVLTVLALIVDPVAVINERFPIEALINEVLLE